MQVLFIIAIVIGVIWLYFWLLSLFFRYVAIYVFALGAIAMTVMVFVNYFRALGGTLFWGTGWQDSPDGSEPAFRQYFFRKAFHDYAEILRSSHKLNMLSVEWVINAGTKFFKNAAVLITWPLGVVFYAIGAVALLPAAAVYLVFGSIHSLLIVVLCGITLIAAAIVRTLEYGLMLWRRIFLACPACYRKIALPVYHCPGCGAVHERLIPGTYGIFRRHCQCGQSLATLFLFGRSSLPGYCPHCSAPLSATIGTIRNIHIPVVGGPAAGKTSYLMASMVGLRSQAASGALKLEFPEKRDKGLFEACRTAFSVGSLVLKTAEYSPNAFLASVTDSKRNKVLLYLYDAAGELFQSLDTLRAHEYYSYTHGILFLIDPFSLPAVQSELADLIRPVVENIKPCAERPQDVYDRVIGMLRSICSSGTFSSRPLAVVVTKVDAFGLEKQMCSVDSRASASSARVHPEDVSSGSVRQWLLSHGEGNLIRSMERDFKNVRYFHCSALGRVPDGQPASFAPKDVLGPLAWTLRSYGVRLD